MHSSLKACTAAQQKLAKLFRNGVMNNVIAQYPDPSPSVVITAALSGKHFLGTALAHSARVLSVSCSASCYTQHGSSCCQDIRKASRAFYCCWTCLTCCMALCAVALSPDKSSLAAEKLKDNLRAEGVLEQLVFSAQYHARQQDQAASTSCQHDTNNRYLAMPLKMHHQQFAVHGLTGIKTCSR